MANPFEWKFLDEPLWRWFVFLVAIGIMLAVWNKAILGLMG